MRKIAVIVAGGIGRRAGGDIPKQFREVAGFPVIWHSMHAFHMEDPTTEIIIVIHPDWAETLENIMCSLPADKQIKYSTTTGGATRLDSVHNGLKLASCGHDEALVAIHDAARPLITPSMIRRGWMTAANNGSAVPVIPVVDSLREISGSKSSAIDRTAFRIVQTPQIFNLSILMQAYESLDYSALPTSLTDDASVMEHAGHQVTLYEGIPENLKITTPPDFKLADILLRNG